MRSLAAAGKRLNEDQKRKWNLYKRWVECFNANREKMINEINDLIVGGLLGGISIKDLQDERLFIGKCFPSVTRRYKGYFLQCDFAHIPESVWQISNFIFNNQQNHGWFIPKFAHISPIYPLHTIPLKPFVFLDDIVMPWEIWVVRKDNSVLIDDLLLLRVGVKNSEVSNSESLFEYKDLQLNVIVKFLFSSTDSYSADFDIVL